MLPCYAFSPVSPLIISVSFNAFPTILPFFAYISSFLYSNLWTPPFSLTLTPACQLFPIPSGEYVPLHGANHLIFLMLFVYQCSGQSLRITTEKLELSTHLLLLHECGLLPLSCSISVSVVWQRGYPHCTVGQDWEKWFPVGVWGLDPFLSPLLSGVLSAQGISPLWFTAEMGC